MQELIRADSCYCCFLSESQQHAFPYRKYTLKPGGCWWQSPGMFQRRRLIDYTPSQSRYYFTVSHFHSINCKTNPANNRVLLCTYASYLGGYNTCQLSHKNPVYLQHIWRIKPLGLRGYLSRLELLNNKIGYPNILPSANYWAIANFITSVYRIDTTVFHCFYYGSFPTARPDPHNKSSITAKNQKACRF